MSTDFDPILVECISTDNMNDYQRSNTKVGDRYVLGRYYVGYQVESGNVKVILEMPAGTPFGDYK